MAGLNEGGGLALLTGEVGTGKTTTLRALLERLPEGSDVALILNPTLDATGLLEAICDDLSVSYERDGGLKSRYDALYQRLIDNHASGRLTVLLIDEAQHLAPEVLEQLRLLTNIETYSQKLLRVILIGQPDCNSFCASRGSVSLPSVLRRAITCCRWPGMKWQTISTIA